MPVLRNKSDIRKKLENYAAIQHQILLAWNGSGQYTEIANMVQPKANFTVKKNWPRTVYMFFSRRHFPKSPDNKTDIVTARRLVSAADEYIKKQIEIYEKSCDVAKQYLSAKYKDSKDDIESDL